MNRLKQYLVSHIPKLETTCSNTDDSDNQYSVNTPGLFADNTIFSLVIGFAEDYGFELEDVESTKFTLRDRATDRRYELVLMNDSQSRWSPRLYVNWKELDNHH